MANTVIGKLTTWWNAVRDRANELPRRDATGLSDFERRVVGAANAMIRTDEIQFIKSAHPRSERLERHERELASFDDPGRTHAVAVAGGRNDTDRCISHTMHLVLLVIITLSEMVLNAQAFAIFGESTVMTLVMAMAVGLGLPTVAYVLGAEIRQQDWTGRRALLWGSVVAVVASTLAGINYVRGASIAASHEELVIDAGIDLSYLVINAFIFAATAISSYYAHDSVPGFIATADALDGRHASMAACRGEINRAVEQFRARQEQIRQGALSLISYYRAVNRRGREGLPDYFDNDGHADCVPTARFLNIAPHRRD